LILRFDRAPSPNSTVCRKLKRLFVGTAPLSGALRSDFTRRFGVDPLQSYGLSEMLLVTSNVSDRSGGPGSVGQSLDGVEIRFVDDDGRACDEGEVWIKTPDSMVGYLEDPDAMTTHHPAIEGWFPSGDIGRLDVAGHLNIVARKKDLIIRGGFNINPRDAEEIIEAHPAVDRAAVVGVPHEFYGEDVVAVVTLRDGFDATAARTSIMEHCQVELGVNSRPRRLIVLDELPTSVTGKIQKHKIIGRLVGADGKS